MKKIQWLGIVLIASVLGCSKSAPVTEPPGKAITLSDDDRRQARMMYDEMKEWAAWNMKGNALKSTRDGRVPTQDDLEMALYCFHQAEKAWPKKLPNDVSDERKARHRPFASDTMLSKGHVYLLMKQPKLAKYYYELWARHNPGSTIAAPEIAKAEAMIQEQAASH